MTLELPPKYVPADVEPAVAQRWSAAGAFHAQPHRAVDSPALARKPFCIVIPPPNVTGALHMGHALNNTLQDILIRWRRMAGDNVLWMPGTDHAGIATQTVVEKRVLAERGKKRTDFSREEFVQLIQAWKDEYEARITSQLKAMGCSCDWERQRFTMDEVCAAAVREAFFRLFQAGLIYRGKRLVNWDPATQTALADDEVENEEIDGHFWYLKYPLDDGSGFLTVATTRPETMLGDTAVAVNPRDPRAPGLRGKRVRLPIVNRVIPIIEDDYVVLPDPESGDEKARFSSGFLKVTPAHDPNDYELGRKYNLPLINVMAPDGSISDQHGWPPEEWIERVGPSSAPAAGATFLLGLDRYEAREAIVEWFRSNHLLADVKPYRHVVGHSYRSHVPIEPYLSDQWYVKVTDDRLAGAALRAMQGSSKLAPGDSPGTNLEGRLRFIPDRYAQTFRTWHENIRDWCISRQLWWGHRIPVWSKESGDLAKWRSADVALHDSNGVNYVCLRKDDPQLISRLEADGFTRDPDVLDTWFSSALWPISTMGWPHETDELKTWNPSSVLSTGRDIITLWVSRMVMFNLFFRSCLPFTDVFIHATILDGQGRRMSKSLGNGVDPVDIIHSHGSDAMRFTLAKMTTNTQDVRLPVVKDESTGRNTSDKFDEGRNFANKLWNAVRFAMTYLDERAGSSSTPASASSLVDRWILSRLHRTIAQVNADLESYEFSLYAQTLYEFVWRDFCDWYLEAIKPTVKNDPAQQQVLRSCIDAILRLLHPVMPFVTERLFEALHAGRELLVKSAWPRADASLVSDPAEQEFQTLQRVVGAIRETRTTYKVPPKKPLDMSAKVPAFVAQHLLPHRTLVETLTGCVGREIGPKVEKPADAAVAVVGEIEIYLHSLVNADEERSRLNKREAEIQKSIAALNGRLANKAYTDKAPPHLVKQTRDQLAAAERELAAVRQQLAGVV